MDISSSLSYIYSNATAIIVVGLLGLLVVYLLLEIGPKWRCAQCGERFGSEEEAKGHQGMHAEHKAVSD